MILEIKNWGELALLEKLLSDYSMKVGYKQDPNLHARALLERIRPLLIKATKELEL